MLAPSLDLGKQKNARHFIFPDQILLPFTEDSRYAADAKAIQGGFGTIFKVNIHPEHYNFHGPGVSLQAFYVMIGKRNVTDTFLRRLVKASP